MTAWLALCKAEPAPRGYVTSRYDVALPGWVEVEDDAVDGFYRYQHYHREYRLKPEDSILKTPRDIGIYAWLQHEGRIVLNYSPQEKRLSGPASSDLPPLYARAATLCTGLLPRFEFGQLYYDDVPPSVANHLQYKLCQTK